MRQDANIQTSMFDKKNHGRSPGTSHLTLHLLKPNSSETSKARPATSGELLMEAVITTRHATNENRRPKYSRRNSAYNLLSSDL